MKKNKAKKAKKEKKILNKGGREKKHTKAFIEKVADELLKWSDRQEELFLYGFIEHCSEYVRTQAFSEWAAANQYFAEVLYKVKNKLLNRLMVGACFKRLDSNFSSKVLPLVNSEYKEWRSHELQLGGDNKDKKIEVIVRSSNEETKGNEELRGRDSDTE